MLWIIMVLHLLHSVFQKIFTPTLSSLSTIFRTIEHILAVLATIYIAIALLKILRGRLPWWRLVSPWWPRWNVRGNWRQDICFPFDVTRSGIKYNPLPPECIRLFVLAPGWKGERIRGHLFHTSLKEYAGQYEALSYSWGMPKQGSHIEVDGQPVGAQDNLVEALHHLRHCTVPRVLWIDAICINQSGHEEKGTQVAMMPEIYRGAKTVQIWLGLETASTAAGMNILKFLEGGEDLSTRPVGDVLANITFSSTEADGLKDILGRSWFDRAWVVQEASLSRKATLNIGDQSLSWDTHSAFRFLKRIKFAEVTPRWRNCIQVDMKNLRELLELSLRVENGVGDMQEPPDLLDVVHEMRHRKCTVESDRIYSVLALAPDGREFNVDYHSSVEDTFQRLYQYTMTKYQDRWGINTSAFSVKRSLEAWRILLDDWNYGYWG